MGAHTNSEVRRAKQRSSKGAEEWVLVDGMFFPPPMGLGECCKLSQWVPGRRAKPGDTATELASNDRVRRLSRVVKAKLKDSHG